METDRINKCLNCNQEVNGDYCSNCGQRANLPRITFKEIIADFLSTVFNIDAPFPKTYIRLFKNPGKLVREVIEGKRKSYYAPIRYLILCLFITLLLNSIIGFNPMENQVAANAGYGLDRPDTTGMMIGKFMHKYINYFVLLLPFTIALVTRIFFWRPSYNIAERTVLGFYISGQYLMISIVFVALTLVHPIIMMISYPFLIAYIAYSYISLFNIGNKLWQIVKGIFAAIITILIYFGFATSIAYLIIMNFEITV